MTQGRTCIQDLNKAIALAELLKVDLRRGKRRQAIDRIADILAALGQTLVSMNQLEAAQDGDDTAVVSGSDVRSSTAFRARRTDCIRLVDLAIANFKRARRLIRLGRYEEAEDAIAASLTGRILRCVNHLRT